MNCVNCGVSNLEGAVFCHNCGGKLVTEQSVNQTQEVAAAQQQQPAYQGFTQMSPQGVQQAAPSQGFAQVPPQGVQQAAPSQGFAQVPPQGVQQVAPSQGFTQVPPQGVQQVQPSQGYSQAPQGNNFQQQPQGYYPPQQGYEQPYTMAPAVAKDQLKPVKDYFKYVLAILKNPHVEAFAKDKTALLFGAINIIAFAVLFGLTTWFMMDSILHIFGRSAPFISSFIVPIIASAFFLSIGGCVAFGLNKLNQLTTNFTDVMSQWFAYMAIPAAIMPLIFLTVLVGLTKLSLLLLAVVLITIFASAASIVQNYKLGEKHVIDPLYSTGVMFAVQGLVLYFILDQVIGSIVSTIGNSFTNMFGGW